MCPVHFRQQRHVPAGVFGRETSAAVRHRFDHTLLAVLADQSCHLRQAHSCDFAQIRPDRSTLFLALHGVLLSHQHLLNKSVHLGPVLGRELDRPAAFEELLDLFLGEHICVLHT